MIPMLSSAVVEQIPWASLVCACDAQEKYDGASRRLTPWASKARYMASAPTGRPAPLARWHRTAPGKHAAWTRGGRVMVKHLGLVSRCGEDGRDRLLGQPARRATPGDRLCRRSHGVAPVLEPRRARADLPCEPRRPGRAAGAARVHAGAPGRPTVVGQVPRLLGPLRGLVALRRPLHVLPLQRPCLYIEPAFETRPGRAAVAANPRSSTEPGQLGALVGAGQAPVDALANVRAPVRAVAKVHVQACACAAEIAAERGGGVLRTVRRARNAPTKQAPTKQEDCAGVDAARPVRRSCTKGE